MESENDLGILNKLILGTRNEGVSQYARAPSQAVRRAESEFEITEPTGCGTTKNSNDSAGVPNRREKFHALLGSKSILSTERRQ
jgi:hypothetical protein